jgi:hypothetical protein
MQKTKKRRRKTEKKPAPSINYTPDKAVSS